MTELKSATEQTCEDVVESLITPLMNLTKIVDRWSKIETLEEIEAATFWRTAEKLIEITSDWSQVVPPAWLCVDEMHSQQRERQPCNFSPTVLIIWQCFNAVSSSLFAYRRIKSNVNVPRVFRLILVFGFAYLDLQVLRRHMEVGERFLHTNYRRKNDRECSELVWRAIPHNYSQ